MEGQGKRLLMAGVVAVFAMIALAVVIVVSSGGQEKSQTVDLASCQGLYQNDVRPMVDCVSRAVDQRLKEEPNPTRILPEIDRQVNTMGDEAKANCHVAMHLTGSRFAKEKSVTLATMQQYLPASDSTNCSAGFTHGMISVMGVNPVQARQMAEEVCSKEPTRARQFACVHGIGHGLRRYLGDPRKALRFCRTLRSRSAVSDCGQGVYHDFFLAAPAMKDVKDLNKPLGKRRVTMADLVGMAKSRERSTALDRLCLDQPPAFLRECWYRLAAGPGVPVPVETARDIAFACGGLDSVQREGCIAGLASARIPPDDLVKVCAELPRQQEVGLCIDGINLVSVGWDPPEGKTPEQYHREDIPPLLKDCERYIKSEAVRRSCVERVAQFSFRSVPASINLKGAQSVCEKLSDDLKGPCEQAVSEIYRESSQSKV